MPYMYRCAQCNAHADRRDHREDAEHDQDEHRAQAHGGLAPADGDSIERVHADARGDGVLPSGSCLAVLILLVLVLSNCWGR